MHSMPLVPTEAITQRSINPASKAAVDYRWQVWRMQQLQGLEPCFRTEQRHACASNQCPWRHECQIMVAEWQI